MAWVEADIIALETAIKEGVQRVRYAGPPEREVEYHSLDAMRRLLAEMRATVNGSPTYRRAQFKKGFR